MHYLKAVTSSYSASAAFYGEVLLFNSAPHKSIKDFVMGWSAGQMRSIGIAVQPLRLALWSDAVPKASDIVQSVDAAVQSVAEAATHFQRLNRRAEAVERGLSLDDESDVDALPSQAERDRMVSVVQISSSRMAERAAPHSTGMPAWFVHNESGDSGRASHMVWLRVK